MEGAMANLSILFFIGNAKGFERLVLRSGSEGIEIGIRSHLAPLAELSNSFVDALLFVFVVIVTAQHLICIAGHTTALAAMCLVNDHGELFS